MARTRQSNPRSDHGNPVKTLDTVYVVASWLGSGARRGAERKRGRTLLDTMYLLISFRRSTPPQNCQLHILIRNSERYIDDFVGKWTF